METPFTEAFCADTPPPAGPRLDALIQQALMACEINYDYGNALFMEAGDFPDDPAAWHHVPNYSTDLNDAFRLIDSGRYFCVKRALYKNHWQWFATIGYIEREGNSPAHAVAMTWLAWREEQSKSGQGG